MKTRRRKISEDALTIARRRTRLSKTSTNGIKKSAEPIPIDLIIEILSRLPAKSVARCRCVSKLWSSTLRCPYFTELFLTISRTRPQLLFAITKQGKLLFFSSPQPQNPDLNSSPVALCANRLMHFPINISYWGISGPVHGLVCLIENRLGKGVRKETVVMICNPSTGQSLPLPKVKTRSIGVKIYLGYDPIDKQFKVLSMSWSSYDRGGHSVFDEYQILTLGTGNNLSWRMINCCIPPHFSDDKGICIDGVLYYRAREYSFSRRSMIVCFDVRSEKFRFITFNEDSSRIVGKGNLINYNGKLGSIVSDQFGDIVDGITKSIELWVLEDAEKQEWSKRTYVLPDVWQNLLGTDYIRFVGVTRRNEIVFSPHQCMPFCLVYYNIERNTITKVGFQGVEEFNYSLVYKFLDYVEDVKLMQVF